MGQQLTRTAAKFEALIDAFEFVGLGQLGEHEAYLRTETGNLPAPGSLRALQELA
jgi:hypothetical protein